jgi:hypothetical protein
MVLAYIDSEGPHRESEGFVGSDRILTEMQDWGFSVSQIEDAIRRCTNKKLVETAERVTFEEDDAGLLGDLPERFRITTIGAYHLKRWIGEFAYMDAMSFDTRILNAPVLEKLRRKVESFAIEDRLSRATEFRDYLSDAWHKSRLTPAYFSWPEALRRGNDSFYNIQRFIAKRSALAGVRGTPGMKG